MDWTDLEHQLVEATATESAWAEQADTTTMHYKAQLERILDKAVTPQELHQGDDARLVAIGIYKAEEVYALRSSWLKLQLELAASGAFRGDIADWLRREGWIYSKDRAVLRRDKVWYMPVAEAKKKYTLGVSKY
jgi:hypothetical protein